VRLVYVAIQQSSPRGLISHLAQVQRVHAQAVADVALWLCTNISWGAVYPILQRCETLLTS